MKNIIDPFIISLIAAIILAYLSDAAGFDVQFLRLGEINAAGVGCIFFLYGLRLRPADMAGSFFNWKLNLVSQASTFLLFPAMVLPFYFAASHGHYYTVWLAVFFLACLPSTVSSSVVMVSIAKGNVPAAIFNASISGIIGILATPLLISGFVSGAGIEFEASVLAKGILLQVLAPVAAGMVLHRWWGKMAFRYRPVLAVFDKSVIVSIVFHSFSVTFAAGLFSQVPPISLIVIVCACAALFAAAYFATGRVSRIIGLPAADVTAAQFCGSKKSLVHGTVFSSLIFPASGAGIFLLPIMCYHALQLVAISFIAKKRGGTS
jgi:solute carrier family 10 (sodium/bile acid cotransporter), member 7